MSKRHMIQVKETLWERLIIAAANESKKHKQVITPAEYVRQCVNRCLKRNKITKGD